MFTTIRKGTFSPDFLPGLFFIFFLQFFLLMVAWGSGWGLEFESFYKHSRITMGKNGAIRREANDHWLFEETAYLIRLYCY